MATKKTKIMTSNVQATAMAIAGRASRACDGCGIQRACWYCAADEAHLCAKCDSAVHSANVLALRHERVRLPSHGVPFPKSFKRSSSSVSSKHSKNGGDAGASASPTVLLTDQVKQLHFPQAQASAAAPSSPDILMDPKILVARHCQPAQDQLLPSRKRSRTTRPHPHHLRNATGGGGGEGRGPPYKIQKSSGKDEGMVQVKIESIISDFDLTMNDDEASKKRFKGGGAHEVPAFINVVRDMKNSEISPRFNAGFIGTGRSSSGSFSPIFKGKAAQAYAQDDLSDDADQYLVPDYFNNCLDSGVDVCCDVDGTISLVEDASAVKEEENIAAVVKEVKAFSSKDQLSAKDFEASTEAGSPNFGLVCELKDSTTTETENHKPPQLSDPSHSTKSLPGSVKLESSSSGYDTESVKKEAQETLSFSLEALSEEGLRQVPCLRLDYEDVLNAWSDREAFWIDPQRARLLNAVGSTAAATGRRMQEEEVVGVVPVPNVRGDPRREVAAAAAAPPPCAVAEAGRQARVLRYKEKRRIRLFSKTIRYQVRKLNAERRPRMKGRFVKSSNSASS